MAALIALFSSVAFGLGVLIMATGFRTLAKSEPGGSVDLSGLMQLVGGASIAVGAPLSAVLIGGDALLGI